MSKRTPPVPYTMPRDTTRQAGWYLGARMNIPRVKNDGRSTSRIVMLRTHKRAHKRGETRAVSRKKIIRHVLRAASSRSRKASFPCICKSMAILPVALHRKSAIFELFSDSSWRNYADISVDTPLSLFALDSSRSVRLAARTFGLEKRVFAKAREEARALKNPGGNRTRRPWEVHNM